jgi:EAL domain-containing protein (putative c-di-GMP-specific phosphodiesterase class I)
VRYRVLLVALIGGVLLLGLGASWLVRDAAREVANSSQQLVQQAFADMRALEALREDLLRHERLAYEAYGAVRPGDLNGRQNQLARRIEGRWARLPEWGLKPQQVATLERHWSKIREQTRRLYDNLRAENTGWEAARSQLATMQEHRQAMRPILRSLNQDLEARAESANSRNRANLDFMARLVTAYTVAILLIAAAVAWILWRLVRASRANRALAEFPHRNPNPVLTLDRTGVVRYANPAAREFAAHLEGAPASPQALFSPETTRRIQRARSGSLEAEHGSRVCRFEWEWLPDLARFHVYVRDVTERRRAEERLRRMAYEDPVTGLPNRSGLLEVLETRLGSGPAGVLTVSLERFDQLTTQYGFEAADAFLSQVGAALGEVAADCLEAGAVVGRLDGPLFGVVASHRGLGSDLAEALLARLPREVQAGGALFQAVYRIGVRPPRASDGAGDGAHLLRDANAALVAAERSEQGRVVEHDEALRAAEDERARVEARLRQALREERGLQAYVQPKLRLDDGAVVGGELLARWNDPDLGWVSPGQFIPVAEQSGLIAELGDWVLERAVGLLARWQARPATQGAHLAVNVAAPELYDPGFADRVLRLLSEWSVPGQLLEVEVTERVLAGPEDWVTVTNLRQLRAAGVAVSVDDFGTGYSSLAYINRLPISHVKVDKQFVDALPASGGARSLAGVIVDMASALGLGTVAEGVETEDQAAELSAMGCHQVQGFLYARPMPAADFPAFLEARNSGPVSVSEPGDRPD